MEVKIKKVDWSCIHRKDKKRCSVWECDGEITEICQQCESFRVYWKGLWKGWGCYNCEEVNENKNNGK